MVLSLPIRVQTSHYFVTEYGIVNLKGLSSWQRAEALISVAHPDFRDRAYRRSRKDAYLETEQ